MTATVIKVGGSLGDGAGLRRLCAALADLAARHPLLIVPGGGAFADAVRACDRRYHLGDDPAHWMAVLAMDQYGYLLYQLMPGSQVVRDLPGAASVSAGGRAPVLLPAALLQRCDPLPHSWDVTSDSLAAWIALQAGASRLVLLKDVDGLYDRAPGPGTAAALLPEIPASRLAGCEGVDAYLPWLLARSPLEVWVINGEAPARLEELLSQGFTRGTRVPPAAP